MKKSSLNYTLSSELLSSKSTGGLSSMKVAANDFPLQKKNRSLTSSQPEPEGSNSPKKADNVFPDIKPGFLQKYRLVSSSAIEVSVDNIQIVLKQSVSFFCALVVAPKPSFVGPKLTNTACMCDWHLFSKLILLLKSRLEFFQQKLNRQIFVIES